MHSHQELMRAVDRLEMAAMWIGSASSRTSGADDARVSLVDARADLSRMLIGAFSLPPELRLAVEATYPALDARKCKMIKRRLVDLLAKLK